MKLGNARIEEGFRLLDLDTEEKRAAFRSFNFESSSIDGERTSEFGFADMNTSSPVEQMEATDAELA